MKKVTTSVSLRLSKFIVISFLLICSNINVFSQCTVCATCTTSSTTGCNFTVSANSSQNFSFAANSGGKMCIDGGTYTGNVTIVGGNNLITIVVAPGAVFSPASITYGVFINGSFTLEVQPGGTAILPDWALGYNGSVTIRNCGVLQCTGSLLLPGTGTGNGSVTIQNNGIFTVAGTLKFGTNGGRTICNSDTMHLGNFVITGNISSGVTNNGYIEVDSSWNIAGTAVTNTLCPNSLIYVKGNWTDNSSTKGTSCGKIQVGGESICNSCHMTGVWDFCDTSGAAPTKVYPNPKVDSITGFGASWASTITYCSNCVQSSSPSVTANGGAVCVGSCFSLSATASSGTPPYTYSWSPNIGTGAGPFSVCPGNTTVYTVIVTDAANNTATDTAQVTVMATPLVDINPPFSNICTGSGVLLTASGAVTYTWIPAAGLSSTTIANPTANPASTTTYTVTGTGANGCTATATAKVTVNPLPVVSIYPPAPMVCFGSSVALSASGGASYSWIPATGLNSPDSNYTTASPTATTTYTLMATDTNGCTAVTTVQVIVNSLPVISISPSAPTVCGGLSVALSASGGVSYSWSPSAGLSNPNSANPLANPTTTTTYTLTATDINGCTGVAMVKVTVNPVPVASISHSATIRCDSNTIYIGYGPQSITLTANTTTILAKYQWYLNSSAIAGDTTNSITVSSGGDYNVIVSDTSGCMSDSMNTAIMVKFVDIRCGHNNDKVLICHVPDCKYPLEHTLCIAPSAIAAHLRNHPCDCLGNCSNPRMANDIVPEDAEFNAYPNPFTNETMIEFIVPEDGNVKLELFDMKGALSATPFDGIADGDHLYQIEVDGSKLSQGVYIGSLTTSEGVKHLKLIVTK